jgi:transcription initiation factor TFIIIB Brf1 subunit/transcription initiation factor TFIIB
MYCYMSKNNDPTHHGVVRSYPSQPTNCTIQTPYKMARNIDSWQRKMIIHMICSKNRLTTSQIAKVAQCSERSITHIRKNLRLFGSARSPPVSVGRHQVQWLVGWLISFTLTPRNEKRYAAYLNYIYIRVRTCRVFHFLKTNLEPRQDLPWPNCRSRC